MLQIEETGFEGLKIITPKVFKDERGYFFESYNANRFDAHGITYDFVQDNQSYSTYGVLRGMHFQMGTHAQTKLVRCTRGEVYDVVVDLRKNQPTYGKWFGINLNEENQKQLLIPRGFAHGFLVLSPTAYFMYKCDNFYNKDSESGLCFNDIGIQIEWPIDEKDLIINEKDLQYTSFNPENDYFA
ncbi:MAG: dTDP-4-dehydrorhamnose 3,5-epimerase [Chitinophagales bacterium]|jgi:dTDP-4-dehydrorhamnose 3,5-epimerase|nr:dTDP-4-dehydrorhamnose 3,5-epimerase [Chitinophagales bacterium]